MAVTLRPLTTADRELLRTACVFNINWPGERFTFADLDGYPGLSHYVQLAPERGDFGVVAEQGGNCVGVAWLLFLDSSDPGYGYVADGIPELGITVWTGYRRKGIGRQMLQALIDEARSRGIREISLSVEDGNPSVLLYTAFGFKPVPDAPAEGTYSLPL
ncbi:GNAT family N-acetyltransferase [Buchananella felis]|uniref:GNAT family N-acetyltransferase n=1 Tax=Buchananella felis TaxID=3231492 RepID=UPI003529298B